jgi:hypothetical protein
MHIEHQDIFKTIKQPQLWLYIAFIMAVSYAILCRLNPIHFNPVNGDFQTFNAASRFLNGQAPYQDFANYLGMGPTILTAFATYLFGGKFASSLAGAEVVVALTFVYMTYIAAKLAGDKRPIVFALSLYLLVYLVLYGVPTAGDSNWNRLFNILEPVLRLTTVYLFRPGQSLLSIRSSLPFLALIPLIYYLKIPSIKNAVIFGGVLGAGVTWSNDYGPITGLTYFMIANVARYNIKRLVTMGLASVLTFVIAIAIITHGHPQAWLDFTLRVATDQYWYYRFWAKKAVSPFDLNDMTATYILLFGYVVSAHFLLEYKKKHNNKDLYLFSLLLACSFGSTLSMIGSLWDGYYTSPVSFLLFVIGITKAKTWISANAHVQKYHNAFGFVFVLAIAAGIVSIGHVTINHKRYPPRNEYEVKLGGQLDSEFDGFKEMLDHVKSKGGRPWSTYATASEAALGIYQPSGIDYVIHVLGDAERTRYLDAFHKANPSVVITPRSYEVVWEPWSRHVNWWFYRELMKDYKETYKSSVWSLWEKTDHYEPIAAHCLIERINDTSVNIRLTPSDSKQHIGDLIEANLTYSSKSPFWTHPVVNIQDKTMGREIASVLNRKTHTSEKYPALDYYGTPLSGSGPLRSFYTRINNKGEGELTIALYPNNVGRIDVSGCTAHVVAESDRVFQ